MDAGKARIMTTRRVASMLFAAVSAMALWRICYLPYRCNVREKTLVATSEHALKASEATVAIQTARTIIQDADHLLAECPHEIDLMMIRAANQRVIGDFAGAANTYRHAIDVQKRQELYFELGSTELALGNRDAAADAYTNCVRFYPPQIANIVDSRVRAAVEERVFRRK